MSKKKGNKKAAKQAEPDAPETPIKSTMEIIFESHLNTKSLTVSQQKSIVSMLGLTDHSLYDSLIIDIITEFLRFAKSKGLSPVQTDGIYQILQDLLYKLQNEKEWDMKRSSTFLKDAITDIIRPETDSTTNPEDGTSTEVVNDSNINKNNEDQSDQISREKADDILFFFEDRLLSQYTLYRTALFTKNPFNEKYTAFKERFEVGDIVRFDDKECLFEIEQFGDNAMTIKCLNEGFKSVDTENEEGFTVKYTISKEQCHSISLVSKSSEQRKADSEQVVDETNDEREAVKEKEESPETVKAEWNEEEEERNQEDTEKVADAVSNEVDGKEVVDEEVPRTLIDVLVDRKVEERLISMKQTFDLQLREYRQQLTTLQNESQ